MSSFQPESFIRSPTRITADLQKNAGGAVSLTGDVNGDTITVTKLMMEKKK